MPNGIWDKETYMNAQPKTQSAMTFDMLKAVYDTQVAHTTLLQNRKWKDKAVAGGSGLAGGFLAVISLALKKALLP